MNGFQIGFIESIVEISSYHLQVSARADAASKASVSESVLVSRLTALPSVKAVVPFAERQSLVEGIFQRPRVCSVRAVPPDLFAIDPVQARMLATREGGFALSEPLSVVIGSELATASGARVGDLLSITSLASGPGSAPRPRRDAFTVTGIFHTGYYDFDAGLLFISLESADALYGQGEPVARTYGVKIADRLRDSRALQEISTALEGTGFRADSWRGYNKSFFDALFMEKLLMMVLVGIIFLVVGFNVYHSLRRRVFERMEEIAVLKAVGIPPILIQGIFILEGLFIGLAGSVSGLLLGLAISMNVNGVFTLVERAGNALIAAVRLFASPFSSASGGSGFAIFSPMYFYLDSVPSRVYPGEAFLVVFFALLACIAAAGVASRAVARFRPAEILRYE
jgi:lipoprotein-releasing system permease protein